VGASPLLVFADDWGRHPSSCQHLVRRLLDRYPVCWVNTIGTRPPRLDLATVRRGLEKVRHWTTRSAGGREGRPANLRVLNPWMWPWVRSSLDRRLNRELLLRQLLPVVRSLPAPPVAVTTVPVPCDLIGRLPVRRWVYYCVDDFAEWPGLDGDAMRRTEEVLVRGADVLIAVSETLRAKLARSGRSARLLTHGVDLGHLGALADGPALPRLDGLPRPLIIFWGVLDRRMDVSWVKRLAADLTAGTVALVGPAADPDPELRATPRVVQLPPVAYEELPGLAREAAVLVMPYADLPVTRAMQPLKLKEYLATGKPVVARDLPANRDWADCLDLAATAEEFSRAVRQRLTDGLPDERRRARARLAEETWEHKAQLFEGWALAPEPAADLARSS
jgi:glycosyltransferase involved in cell wall biosynthesis